MTDMDHGSINNLQLLSHSFLLPKVFKNCNFNHFEYLKRERKFSAEELFVLSSVKIHF